MTVRTQMAAHLGDQVGGTIVKYLTQSHYPDTELNSPSPCGERVGECVAVGVAVSVGLCVDVRVWKCV